MLSGMKKKLIVVAVEGCGEEGNLLKGLVTVNDDVDGKHIGTRDGEVEVVVWDDKHYEASKNALSSEQNVFFIGHSKRLKSELSALEHFEVFNSFGIKFYENGNFAALLVEDRDTPLEEYDAFYKYCEEGCRKISEKLELEVPIEKEGRKFGGLSGIAAGAKSKLKAYNDRTKIKKQKYSVGVQVFYFEYLQRFLDN